KTKIGKQRRDKYYRLAKETGFRSRAAFKLIQLNKRFEFLQSSKAVVDLCAAPGGWMQVATQNMPVSSICIGVDLSPIRPIPNCIALQGDITTEKTRQAIKKELQTWEADTVLHDGAPNVGKNWIHDAFMQNCLVLSSLKLTTQILKRGGTFVTKVFRSNDSHCLITTFQKLFKRVHVWKPAASRLESAEIFVVCEKYLKPSKVDPDLLDPKKVFLSADLEPEKPDTSKLLLTRKKEKKAKAEGYAEGAFSMHSTISATQFIEMPNHLEVLASTNRIEIDQEMWDKSDKTTDEIRECLKDIKVLAPRELRALIKWRSQMIDLRNKAMKEAGEDVDEEEDGEMEVDANPEEQEDKELAEIDAQIAKADKEEKAALKKKKKKMLKEKAKSLMRRQLKMVHEGDVEDIPDQPDLFSLKRIKKMKDVFAVSGENVDTPMMEESDDDEEKEYTDDGEGLGEGEWQTEEGEEGEDESGEESDDDNELIHTEESGLSKEEKAETRTDKWFNKEEMGALLGEGEDEDELAAVERHLEMKKKRDGKEIHKNTVSFEDVASAKKQKRKDMKADEDDGFNTKDGEEAKDATSAFESEEDVSSDEEFEDEDKKATKRKTPDDKNKKRKIGEDGEPVAKKRHLTAEQLAIGEQMIYSSKNVKELEDWGWNRYMANDEALPDWFVEDEKKHYQKTPPVTKEQMQAYRERLRELNARPIKKVAEAKARKARRVVMRLSKAKKKAEGIVENDTLEHSEKIKEMKKIYKKAVLKEKKEVTYRVVSKGKAGTMSKPSGQYKNVDRRMKSDDKRKKMANKKQSWKNMSSKEKKMAQDKKRKHGAQMKAGKRDSRRQKRGKPT
ncbi:hypothetical protein PFISCL1PPCAC_10131, partial [Pristionchus fissidentatus]